MWGAHSQAPHIHHNPPFWTNLLMGCAQNCPLCRRIWQHGLCGWCGLKPYGLPVGMPTLSAAGSRNWITSSGNMGVTFACWLRPTSGQVKSSGWQTMWPQWPVNWRRRNSYTVPFQGLEHLGATAIPVMLASKPVKILAVDLSPARPLICFGLVCLPSLQSSCLHGRLPECQAFRVKCYLDSAGRFQAQVSPRDDPQPLMPACIQEEIHLKTR